MFEIAKNLIKKNINEKISKLWQLMCNSWN